ncbi:MAG TPA: nickel pincer cofactor biosynthesis protein LarC [Verrucomicrobiae bacterium]|nr:nickel pincer cofactor biosynthesis protein LarC [Verrucomicrobiae bacterium]
MRIAYLECFSGISGDMFIGALIDAGVPPEVFVRTVEALGVDARLEIKRVDRSGISATKVDVIAAGEKELPREEFWAKEQAEHHAQAHMHSHSHEGGLSHSHGEGHSHSHEHGHGHDHSHSHDHENESGHSHSHAHAHRGLNEIREIIGKASISQSAKERAIRIFEALGTAEAKVHNSDIEKIHFHEVGAIDAIVDIVCAAVGSEALGVDEWICSPLNVGGGTVVCAHGTFPIPAPATLELLKHAPVYSGEIQKELVTPTGAAIVSVLASRFSQFPQMKPEKSGYGAGSRDFKGSPNVVRLTIGDAAQLDALPARIEEITILEANVDDMTPQIFGYVMERALALGALDVFGTAVQMKKNRPGILLTVLCPPEKKLALTRLIFTETTTLGVRIRQESRAVLARRHVNVRTPWGEVRMKLANLNGSVSNYAPEYEDCRSIAEAQQVPLKTVMQEAIKIYLEEEKNG